MASQPEPGWAFSPLHPTHCGVERGDMKKISINLPPRYRLDMSLVREKGVIDEPLVPSMDKLRSFRRGNKISRFFRHIFEHRKIQSVLGSNLAVMLIASSLVPGTTNAQFLQSNEADAVIVVQETPLSTEHGVAFPLEKVKINQGYHFFHPGIDLDGEIGDPVKPIMGGRVIEIQHSRFAYGNAITISHGSGLTSLYAHLSKIEVEVGQEVTIHTKIGEVGSTGYSTGSHLHLEIRDSGRPISPLSFLPRRN
ncbi:MAG: Peptidase M23 [Candidatus Woesebacteria bacterium GW2011_GWB1_44_11b]|uniref:Peptidase M23 n=2 Tax=Candidatus Woeseibacteriota TaxID=1752722 RepID=A0A0G1GI98_9BACT|nr:MAG: Peptidase M23 [Candidatus Woesebacteria bacterium GW2011_GWB1_44_11b]